MTIEKEARGWNQTKAKKKNTEVMEYSLDYYDNQLVLDNFWLSPISHKNNPESVRLKLTVPEGKLLYIDNDLASFLSHKIKMTRIIIASALQDIYGKWRGRIAMPRL